MMRECREVFGVVQLPVISPDGESRVELTHNDNVENHQSTYFFLKMKKAPGVPLDEWIETSKQCPNYERNILEIMVALMAIVKEMHEKGVYHRDLSLENIIVDVDAR